MSKASKERIIYFVRHGQSEGNVTPIFQSPDSPLTEIGKQQAERVAARISKLSFDTLISSPWPRTKETAEAIAQATGKVPEFSNLFIERIKPTFLNNRPYEDPEADAIWRAWDISLYTPGHRVEDGENFDDLIKRADKALNFLEKRDESAIVVVTHGFFMRTILARLLLGAALTSEAYKNFMMRTPTANTGISAIKHKTEYGDTFWRLWMFNDQAHLG